MRKRSEFRISVGAPALLMLMLNVVPARVVHAGPAGTPFRAVRHNLIVVSVFVNEEGPFDFLLDTGTNSTVVTPEVAAQLRLRPTERVSLITVAGSRVVPGARLNKLTLGGNTLEDVEVLVDDLREVRALDPRVCGMLGQNFLSRFNYMIDYRNRRLVFENESNPICAGARLPTTQHEGRLIVAARLDAAPNRILYLLLDSAASGILFFSRPQRELAHDVQLIGDGWLEASSNVGTTTARAARARMLQVGEEKFRGLPVALVESGAGTRERTEDGLLPTSLFRAIYFNHREGYVILNPRACR